MKRLWILLAVALLCAPAAFAADAPASAPSTITVVDLTGLDTNHDGKVDKAELQVLLDRDASAADLVSGASDVVKAAEAAKSQWATEKMLAIATALAAAFKLLLSLLKMLGNSKWPWLETTAGKNTIKYSTLIIGALTLLFANIALKMPFVEALILAGAGPLSIAIHEYTSPVNKALATEPPKPA